MGYDAHIVGLLDGCIGSQWCEVSDSHLVSDIFFSFDSFDIYSPLCWMNCLGDVMFPIISFKALCCIIWMDHR